MSGLDNCAMIDPSMYSTIECTIDWGCTTTSMRSTSIPNRADASSTSRPLFIKVEESIVILGPIDQVGWSKASCLVAVESRCAVHPRKGPPDAVSSRRLTSGCPAPPRELARH